jgi:glycosyltransferase involved in cell wall biosynthesis
MVSRLTALKRADLLVQALGQPEAAGIRAVLAGDGEERDRLGALVTRLGLEDRVTLAGRITEAELLGHLARCRVVCFPPYEEDYGFVTTEAFAARKAVVTCRDSGGPAELVEDGVSGFICDPTPQLLAATLRRVMDDKPLAERMGAAAFAAGSKLNWEATVRLLTS